MRSRKLKIKSEYETHKKCVFLFNDTFILIDWVLGFCLETYCESHVFFLCQPLIILSCSCHVYKFQFICKI